MYEGTQKFYNDCMNHRRYGCSTPQYQAVPKKKNGYLSELCCQKSYTLINTVANGKQGSYK